MTSPLDLLLRKSTATQPTEKPSIDSFAKDVAYVDNAIEDEEIESALVEEEPTETLDIPEVATEDSFEQEEDTASQQTMPWEDVPLTKYVKRAIDTKGLLCFYCGNGDFSTPKSKKVPGGILRTKECKKCKKQIQTIETFVNLVE